MKGCDCMITSSWGGFVLFCFSASIFAFVFHLQSLHCDLAVYSLTSRFDRNDNIDARKEHKETSWGNMGNLTWNLTGLCSRGRGHSEEQSRETRLPYAASPCSPVIQLEESHGLNLSSFVVMSIINKSAFHSLDQGNLLTLCSYWFKYLLICVCFKQTYQCFIE